jgi:hypothetical protein
MKTVGTRNKPPASPKEAVARAIALINAADALSPHPRERGFVVKSRTREEYEDWKRSHPNPRFW